MEILNGTNMDPSEAERVLWRLGRQRFTTLPIPQNQFNILTYNNFQFKGTKGIFNRWPVPALGLTPETEVAYKDSLKIWIEHHVVLLHLEDDIFPVLKDRWFMCDFTEIQERLLQELELTEHMIMTLQSEAQTLLQRCPVCDGSMAEGDNRVSMAVVTENYSFKQQCAHLTCAACIVHHIAVNVEQQNRRIICPAGECGQYMHLADIRRHLNPTKPALLEQYVKLLQEKFDENEVTDELLVDDLKTGTCKRCPTCHVIIFRQEGCDSMLCTCGTRFDFFTGAEVPNVPHYVGPSFQIADRFAMTQFAPQMLHVGPWTNPPTKNIDWTAIWVLLQHGCFEFKLTQAINYVLGQTESAQDRPSILQYDLYFDTDPREVEAIEATVMTEATEAPVLEAPVLLTEATEAPVVSGLRQRRHVVFIHNHAPKTNHDGAMEYMLQQLPANTLLFLSKPSPSFIVGPHAIDWARNLENMDHLYQLRSETYWGEFEYYFRVVLQYLTTTTITQQDDLYVFMYIGTLLDNQSALGYILQWLQDATFQPGQIITIYSKSFISEVLFQQFLQFSIRLAYY